MTLFPDLTENKDDSVIMYFSAEGKDIRSLQKEIENTYACISGIGVVTKDGKKYIAVEINDIE